MTCIDFHNTGIVKHNDSTSVHFGLPLPCFPSQEGFPVRPRLRFWRDGPALHLSAQRHHHGARRLGGVEPGPDGLPKPRGAQQ